MNKYYVGRPDIYNKQLFMERVEEILDSHWYTNDGKYVKALESKVCEVLGVNHAVAMANATLGLELSLRCLDEPPGSVVCPSFTFPGTATAISNAGHEPLFADIDEKYNTLVDESIRQRRNSRIVAIMPVDLFGNLLPFTPKILAHPGYSETEYIPVIYDSAHAFMCDKGCSGLANVYSFHSTKAFGACGEGCVITTDDESYAEELRKIRNFGYSTNVGPHGYHESIGTNAKLSELHAASILTQIEHKEEILDHYLSNHYYYSRYLPDWVKLQYPNHSNSNYSYIVCEVDEEIRDNLLEYLHKNNIIAKKYFPPLHLEGVYKQNISLPNTERISRRIFQLPTGLTISRKDVEYICSVIAKFDSLS